MKDRVKETIEQLDTIARLALAVTFYGASYLIRRIFGGDK
jgi:hypothetical protein